ncbi:hypothetical protein Tco_0233553 [Tanacetum coccineum]
MQKESVSKQGRKSAKVEPTVHKDPAFDDIMDDAMDYMESEDAQDKGRTSSVVLEGKESTQKEVSTEVEVSTVKPDERFMDKKVKKDDETIAEFLVSMSQNKAKQKGVKIKDVEDSDRPRATSKRLGKVAYDLKNKNFEEIQVLYKKVKRSDKYFIAIGSTEDERQIKEVNEESKDPKKKRVVNKTPREEDIAKKKENDTRYPLSKELLQRMLDLGLEVDEESTDALHLTSELTSQEEIELLCHHVYGKVALTSPKAILFDINGIDKRCPILSIDQNQDLTDVFLDTSSWSTDVHNKET